MNLYEQLQKRMKLFRLDAPFCIKIIAVNKDGEPEYDERVSVVDGNLTFSITTETSIPTFNELVAKAKLGLEYDVFLCSQRFNTTASKAQRSTFFNTITPLINSFAFREMRLHLTPAVFAKEVREWHGFFDALLSIKDPDHETIMAIIGIYVTLVANDIIPDNKPLLLQKYNEPIRILLELAKEEPCAELLCDASNRISGVAMRASIAENASGRKLFYLEHSA